MDTGEVWWVGEGKDGGSCSTVIKARKAEGRWMMGAKGAACTLKRSHGIDHETAGVSSPDKTGTRTHTK